MKNSTSVETRHERLADIIVVEVVMVKHSHSTFQVAVIFKSDLIPVKNNRVIIFLVEIDVTLYLVIDITAIKVVY